MKNKRKNKLISIFLSIIILSATAFLTVLLFSSKEKFQILDTETETVNIISAEYDIFNAAESINKENIEPVLEELFFNLKSVEVNTLIIPAFNEKNSVFDMEGYTNSLKDTDLLNEVVNLGMDNNIQILLSIDNNVFGMNDLINILDTVVKKENVAGVVLDNSVLSNDEILEINKVLENGDHFLAIKSSDNGYMNTIITNTAVDYFIYPSATNEEFILLSEGNNDTSKVLMHYSGSDFERNNLMLKGEYNLDGVVFTSFSNDYKVLNTNTAYINNENENFPIFEFDVSNEFKVTNPLKNETTYYSGIFITGVGEDNGEIIVNGESYTAQSDGTFGIYYNLVVGANNLEISQNGNTHTVTVTRKTYSSSGSWEMQFDDTKKAESGQVVVATRALTSILNNPDDDGDILAGVPAGTEMIVKNTVETVRSGEKTYAYELNGGGYVLAKYTEFKDEYTPSTLQGAKMEVVSEGDNAGDIILTYNSTGKPAVISFFEEDSLTFAFLDTTITDETDLTSDMFTSIEYAVSDGTNATITLKETNDMIWGYHVTQTDTTTTIYLKKPPQKASGSQPLLGTSIMLDAGHGAQDSGTVGVAGGLGPTEKDLNLAVALATKAMLEEYGATVHLMRSDDTFFELEERRVITNDIKPDLFISLHHNSMAYSYNSNNAYGAEIYYFTKQSENFANAVVDNVSLYTDRNNRGSEQGYYYVTRVDIAPAVLMEYSFLMNPQEYSLTYSNDAIYDAAYGTVMAILETIPE